MKLRPYQREAKEAIFEQWDSGVLKTLLVLPTGCGKTVVFAKVTEDCVRHGDRKSRKLLPGQLVPCSGWICTDPDEGEKAGKFPG